MKKNNNGKGFYFATMISVIIAVLKVFGIINCSWVIVILPIVIDLIIGLVAVLIAAGMIVVFREDKGFIEKVKEALDEYE